MHTNAERNHDVATLGQGRSPPSENSLERPSPVMRPKALFTDCVSRDVIAALRALHFPGCTVVDLTWGKGAFWMPGAFWSDQDVVGIDIAPRQGCKIRANARYAPVKDRAVDLAVFDPPHIWSPGNTATSKAAIYDDYGSMPTLQALIDLYVEGVAEARRIARVGAIVKCADMVKHGRFTPSHAIVMAKLEPTVGWPTDIAILDTGIVRPVRPDQPVLHLRHTVSYFLVYRWSEKAVRL